MSQFLDEFKINLEPIKDFGVIRHHLTMSFFDQGMITHHKESYTLDELEQIECALTDICHAINKYRHEQEIKS